MSIFKLNIRLTQPGPGQGKLQANCVPIKWAVREQLKVYSAMIDSITVFLSVLFLVKWVVVWAGGNVATRDSSSHSKVQWRGELVISGPVLAWFHSFITRSQLINYRAREIKLSLNPSANLDVFLTNIESNLRCPSLLPCYTQSTPKYLQGSLGRTAM